MTGRYPSHTGLGPAVIPPNSPYGMGGKETFLPELLKVAGYATHAIGKVCCQPVRAPTIHAGRCLLMLGTRAAC